MLLLGGIISLVITALLGWWGRPVDDIVSPRIAGWDFYFSSLMFGLTLVTAALLVSGISSIF